MFLATYNFIDITPVGRNEGQPGEGMGWVTFHKAVGRRSAKSRGLVGGLSGLQSAIYWA